MFEHAVTRRPGPDFAEGLTSAGLGKPDYRLVCRQHSAYVETLKALGVEVIELGPLDGHPDAYFVEDPAVVAPGVAVMTIPGAPPRRGEQASLEAVLREYRPIERISPPGTVDGGDVLMVDGHFFIGVSARTNAEGAAQLAAILERHGHTSTPVPVADGLHLKSDVNYLGDGTLLLSHRYERRPEFAGYRRLTVGESESYAANALLLNGRLLVAGGYPQTLARLRRAGYDVVELDVSEVRKMDGGLTCMSLRF